MTLRRKGSRSIIVDGHKFRWTVSSSQQADTGHLTLIVEMEEGGEKGIAVSIPCRDFYLDLSDIDKKQMQFDVENYRPVRPADVRNIILAAKKLGWDPGNNDCQLHLDFDWTHLVNSPIN